MTLRKALGEYHPDTAVIRTKAVQELDVLAHEAFHSLDMKMSLPALKAAMQAHKAELKVLDYDAQKQRLHEGFAEFGRWYVTNPEHARRVAPSFYEAFERALAQERPDVHRGLRDIQAAYSHLLKSASIDVAAASVAHTGRGGRLSQGAQALKDRGLGGVATDLADRAYTAFIDDLHPLAKAVRELQKIYAQNTGRHLDLKAADNPYVLARLSREAYAAGHVDLMEGVVPYHGVDPKGPSLAQALETALGAKAMGKWSREDLNRFDAYLIARRMVNEWDRFSSGDLDRAPDKYSKAFHEQVITDAERLNPSWKKAAGLVYGWLDALWKKEFDAGLLTAEAHQKGLEKPDYVPLMRDVSDKGAGSGSKASGGAMQFAGGAKRFKGSTRDVISPLTSMMRRAYELNALIKRNEVLKTLDDLGRLAGPGGGSIVERLPKHEMEVIQVNAAQALEAAAKAQGLTSRDVTTMLAHVDAVIDPEAKATIFRNRQMDPKKGEAVVFVWRDGEKTPLLLADGGFGQEMFQAIAGMNKEMSNALLDAASAGTQILRHGVTLSPEFMARNIVRDQLATWINTDVGYVPGYHFVKGAVEQARQGTTAKRYAAAGGMRGGAATAALKKPFPKTDPEARTQLQHLRKKGYRVRAYNPLTNPLRGLAAMTDLSEAGTRLGVMKLAFDKAKKRGLNDYEAVTEAAFTSRDYLDFGRRGSRMLSAVRTVTFLNASLQSIDKAIRVGTGGGNLHRVLAPLGKNAPKTDTERRAFAHAYKQWVRISALAVLGGSLAVMYADDPEYQEINQKLRATHWWFKAFDHWIAIPKPFELAEPSNIVERAYEAAALKDPNAPKNMLSDFMQVIAPPHEIPAVSVPYNIARNRDYQGRPIVPDHLRGTVNPEYQFNSYTSEIGKLIGRVLKVSPAVVDYVITGFGGSLGRYAQQGTNLALEKIEGKPGTKAGPEDAFLSRAFVRDVSRGSASQEEFWNLVAKSEGDYTEAVGTFRLLMKAGDHAKATAFLNSLPAPSRAYVQAEALGPGQLAKLHPIQRAREAVGLIGDLRRENREGALAKVSGAPIALTPSQRREVDDALAQLAMTEMRNALVQTGVRGWAQKRTMNREDSLDRLAAVSPDLPRMVSARMNLARVATPDASERDWKRRGPELGAKADPERVSRRITARSLKTTDRYEKIQAARRINAPGPPPVRNIFARTSGE
ncbi:MAG: LPD38 domain-containing protein [Phenylobacterium sp.]|uniref:LPD38 domain-containing protein n=1 Tax=Phenylobacterium sp. TaxID=1871053 RepID=UPI00273710D0|nr:LPD38 domain-containing protein [Phenylobacterium sp.]MDP3176142.1 LPD38 domain-containing protein [Phenylobacterium sp.]